MGFFFNWCKVVINLAVYINNSNQWFKATMKQQQPTWQVSTSFYCVYLLFDTRSVVLQPNCCITADLLYYSRFVVLQSISCFTIQPICCFTVDCCFTTDLLFYSRFVVRGTLWVSEETEKMSHGFYQSAALDIGEDLRQNTLPGCCYEREAGDDDQSSRGQNSSRTLSSSYNSYI